jgi:hypothetical protein
VSQLQPAYWKKKVLAGYLPIQFMLLYITTSIALPLLLAAWFGVMWAPAPDVEVVQVFGEH